MDTLSENAQPHENWFGELATSSETPLGSLDINHDMTNYIHSVTSVTALSFCKSQFSLYECFQADKTHLKMR